MHKGQFIFTQVCKFLPKRAFDCLVNKYNGNKWVKSFTCWNHLLVLIYGQLSNRESLRDLVTSLAPFRNMFHHLGFGANVTRSNLSKANEQRDPRIFEEYALKLISIAREKRTGLKDFFISNNVYAFDSTTISLCLSVFWWTKLHHGKSGVKVHTLFDVKNSIPSFAIITGAEIHDSQVMDQIPYEVDSFYIFDRAYMDTKQLYAIDKVGAFFVVREKQRMVYEVVEDKRYNNPKTGVMSDTLIKPQFRNLTNSLRALRSKPPRMRFLLFKLAFCHVLTDMIV